MEFFFDVLELTLYRSRSSSSDSFDNHVHSICLTLHAAENLDPSLARANEDELRHLRAQCLRPVPSRSRVVPSTSDEIGETRYSDSVESRALAHDLGKLFVEVSKNETDRMRAWRWSLSLRLSLSLSLCHLFIHRYLLSSD